MTDWPLVAAVAVVAAVYASVGHAGATGYIAVMTLWGLTPEVIRPTALLLNVVVATIGTVQFARAGHFDRRLLLPLAVASVPAAAVGGWLALPKAAFETLLGIVLGITAIRIGIEALASGRGPPGDAAGPTPLLPADTDMKTPVRPLWGRRRACGRRSVKSGREGVQLGTLACQAPQPGGLVVW